MSNPTNARGDVSLGGHALRADFNALCDLEDAFDTDVNGVVSRLSGSPSFRDVRTVVRVLGAFEDDRAAGAAIGSDVGAAIAAISSALAASFPDPSDEAEPGEA